jgi:hypothetical protein
MLRLSRNTQSDKIAEIAAIHCATRKAAKTTKGLSTIPDIAAPFVLSDSFNKFLLPRTDKSIINLGARTIDPGQRCDRLRIKQRAQGDVVLRYFGKRACGMARLVRRRNSA